MPTLDRFPLPRGWDHRLLAGSLVAPLGPAARGDDRTQAFAPALAEQATTPVAERPTELADDLSFDVAEGTVTGFLGQTALEKTTTLRMLPGLVEPTSGTAMIAGRPYAELDAPLHRRRGPGGRQPPSRKPRSTSPARPRRCRRPSGTPDLEGSSSRCYRKSPRPSPHVVMTAHQVRSCGPEVTAVHRSPSTPAAGYDAIPRYEIRVKGHFGPRSSAWFDGLTITTEDDETTVITGPVVNQAALHGLLQKLRGVAIPLVSLRELPSLSTHRTNEGN